MLKYIGLFATAFLITLGLQATSNPTCKNTYQQVSLQLEMDLELQKENDVSAQTTQLLLKKGAPMFNITYLDMCDAFAKGSLTIDKTVMSAANDVMYTLTLDGCALCVFESEL